MAWPGQTRPEVMLDPSRGQRLTLYFIVKHFSERKRLNKHLTMLFEQSKPSFFL